MLLAACTNCTPLLNWSREFIAVWTFGSVTAAFNCTGPEEGTVAGRVFLPVQNEPQPWIDVTVGNWAPVLKDWTESARRPPQPVAPRPLGTDVCHWLA